MDSNQVTIETLNRLIEFNRSSEEGFRISAQNVKGRGLKTLLKTYAQQRATFIGEMETAVQELGGDAKDQDLFLARVHRGWIGIKAALTIGQPATVQVVLAECQRGERYALREYEKALEKPLPDNVKGMLTRQHGEIREVSRQVEDMKGSNGRRLIVRLFDGQEQVEDAVAALLQADFQDDQIQRIEFNPEGNVYQKDSIARTRFETMLTGALGGAAISSVLAVTSAIGVVILPGMQQFVGNSMGATLAFILLGGLLIGGLFGAIFGLLIGSGVSQEDAYVYEKSLEEGRILLLVCTESERVDQASDIMREAKVAVAT